MTEQGSKERETVERYGGYAAVHGGIAATFSREVYDGFRAGYRDRYGDLIPADREARILDLGCGPGFLLHFLVKEGYVNAEGIDASEENVELVGTHVTEKVHHGDGLAWLSGQRGSFDCVVAADVLEHVPKERVVPFVAAVRGALREGGVFLCRVPNMENPFTVYTRWVDFTHEVGFTRNSLAMVLRMGGFPDPEVRPFRGKDRSAAKAVQGILRRIVAAAARGLFQVPRDNLLFDKFILGVARKGPAPGEPSP